MSGHSKWSTIRHKKEKTDFRRGKVFTKHIREITVASRVGGGNVSANTRLRAAISAARAANMPHDNIEKAIKRGTGEMPGITYEEAEYEGYGAGGIAVLVEVVTDNKNRTVADLRYIFSKNGGNMGETGCVAWMFDKRGLILVDKDSVEEENLMEIAIDAGAEDLKIEDNLYEIITSPEAFEKVKESLEARKIPLQVAEVTKLPKSTIKVDAEKAHKVIKLMEALEDHDDVQKVYSNFDIPSDLMEGD